MEKDWSKTKKYRDLKAAMLEDLNRRGLASPAYVDKVEEYMDFWARRRELCEDVKKRGLTVIDERGRVSENRSVSLEIQTARQMLTLFSALGFKAENLNGAMEDDEL